MPHHLQILRQETPSSSSLHFHFPSIEVVLLGLLLMTETRTIDGFSYDSEKGYSLLMDSWNCFFTGRIAYPVDFYIIRKSPLEENNITLMILNRIGSRIKCFSFPFFPVYICIHKRPYASMGWFTNHTGCTRP